MASHQHEENRSNHDSGHENIIGETHHETDHDEDDEHRHGRHDPHIWTAPPSEIPIEIEGKEPSAKQLAGLIDQAYNYGALGVGPGGHGVYPDLLNPLDLLFLRLWKLNRHNVVG